MSINKFNGEGYPDPTAYEALTTVEHEAKKKIYRPLVFICSPFAGDVERNIANSRHYSKFAVDSGAIPLTPHLLYPQFMDDSNKEQRSLGLFFGMVLLCKCDEVWAFGSHQSHGMRLELAKAQRRAIPIKFFNENCEVRDEG